ncbi:MAG: helix-turn-helix domain-containing protein [Planctomycetota bacterium]
MASSHPVGGMLRYIGDRENELLRYFSGPDLPAESDWPLTLFGPNGTGKTSLANNLLGRIAEQNTDKRPEIFEALDFARKFRSAIETNSVNEFHERLIASCGILIDGIQALKSHAGIQNELVNILDRAKISGVPVVVTSLHNPLEGEYLTPQLGSRLAGGLSLPVKLPGSEARNEIIRALAEIHNLRLTDDAVSWLADKLVVTVPETNQFLSGIATSRSVTAHVSPQTSEQPLDAAYFKRIFEKQAEDKVGENSAIIIESVAREMSLKPADLRGDSRKQSIVLARSIAIFLCRKLLNMSFVRIGSSFGNRDHTTIMHSTRKIEALLEADENATTRLIQHLQQTLSRRFNGLQF